MQPPAEHVHWMFATGFLFLGLLHARARRSSATEVWRRRRVARLPLAGARCSLMGVLMWPVMVFYTNSAIHMLAHGAWAQALMLAGAAELGLARGKLQSRSGGWRCRSRSSSRGAAFLVHEQNGVALRALGVPAPPARLDAGRRRALPARCSSSGRARSSSQAGLRARSSSRSR